MAFSTEEQNRLRELKAKGFTFEQAMSEIAGTRTGSPSTISHLVEQPAPQKKTSYLDSVIDTNAELLNKRVDEFAAEKSRFQSGEQSVVETGVQMAGTALATGILDPVSSIVGNVPGAKSVFGTISKGIDSLSKTAPIKFLGNIIGNNEKVAEAVRLYDTDPQFKQTVNSATNIINSALTAKGLVEGGTSLVNKGVSTAGKVGQATSDFIDSSAKKYATSPEEISKQIGIKLKDGDTASSIMNRVARVNPSDATKFEKLSGGKTIGQYLAETGNTNAPERLLTIEGEKFLKSKNAVDTTLAKLPGVYKNGAVDDMLAELRAKAQTLSTKNVPAPFQAQVDELVALNNANGLSMEQINVAKRLYERHVKLGYSKLLNADGIQQATYLDEAVREYQFAEAKRLGFTNLAQMNKQTQISKFIVDKLADKLVGQTGLNSMSLTDVIILAGGTPEAVGGYLTKKFFASKSVQAKIAEMLNKPTSPQFVTPNTEITSQFIERGISPKGQLALPSGQGSTVPTVSSGGVINLGNRSQSTIDLIESNNPNIGTTYGYAKGGKIPVKGDSSVTVLPNTVPKRLPIIR